MITQSDEGQCVDLWVKVIMMRDYLKVSWRGFVGGRTWKRDFVGGNTNANCEEKKEGTCE